MINHRPEGNPAIEQVTHAVQFYEHSDFLADAVAQFLAGGVEAGEALLVVATPAHANLISERIRAAGIDPRAHRRAGRLVTLDADETLGRLLVGTMPDRDRFLTVVGGEVDRLLAAGHPAVRAFGEMVNVLWAQGNSRAAVQLEVFWNELAAARRIAVLCAYSLGGFGEAARSGEFVQLCGLHSQVKPAESHSGTAADGHARELAFLQQRALSLESEIARRMDLERALREALVERERIHAALEVRERELTHDLVERKRMEDLLQEALRARDDFISIASHELRNPLHVLQLQLLCILQAAQSEQEPLTKEGLIDRVTRAADQVTRFGRLIDNLLDVSRITAGRLTLALETVDFAEIVRTVADRHREQLDGVPLNLSLTGGTGRSDRLRIDQVVSNLLSNAIKYGERRPIDVVLQTEADTVRLAVTDRGVGIDAALQSRLFGRFERALAGQTFGGLGLGLWITGQIVRALGGTIAVQSAPRQGATFLVTLPRHATGT